LPIWVEFFDLAQFAGWNMDRIVGLDDTSLQKLRLQRLESVGF
jgi:hypothetical protein